MLQHFLRLFLALALMAVFMSFAEEGLGGSWKVWLLLGSLLMAVVTVLIEIFLPKKGLKALAGLFFGLLVGLAVSYGIALVIDLAWPAFFPQLMLEKGRDAPEVVMVKFLFGIVICYYCVSFVLQTKDDIRFIIPYVEFSKQIKGERPILLDTSVIIDGRINEICDTGIIDQPMYVPRFVLNELQVVADSADRLKRGRGRRGLDILNTLQKKENVDVEIIDDSLTKEEAAEPVDLKLITLAKKLNGRVATNDYNLNKLGTVRGIDIININDLANALKPVALPGESLTVKIIKPGEEPGQGVGYMEDGTMVVVDRGREFIDQVVDVSVTSMLQTSAGRMIFGRIAGDEPGAPPPPRNEGRGRRPGGRGRNDRRPPSND